VSGKVGTSAFVSSNFENISCVAFLKHKNNRKEKLALWHLVNSRLMAIWFCKLTYNGLAISPAHPLLRRAKAVTAVCSPQSPSTRPRPSPRPPRACQRHAAALLRRLLIRWRQGPFLHLRCRLFDGSRRPLLRHHETARNSCGGGGRGGGFKKMNGRWDAERATIGRQRRGPLTRCLHQRPLLGPIIVKI
jgi:hypothetical protein